MRDEREYGGESEASGIHLRETDRVTYLRCSEKVHFKQACLEVSLVGTVILEGI